MMISQRFLATAFLLSFPRAITARSSATARWMAEEALWGTLGFVNTTADGNENAAPVVSIVPVAASRSHHGRIFFYLMGENKYVGSSLTLSQASLVPDLFGFAGCGTLNSAVDSQDPRCVKATYLGEIQPCSLYSDAQAVEECEEIGLAALFEKHPSMKDWPDDHHFHVHELVINSVWMIAGFGGGSDLQPEEYADATGIPHEIEDGANIASVPLPLHVKVPEWNELAHRARWIVYHSRWATISTTKQDSVSPTMFGNIRSVTDGSTCQDSSGRPFFYLPDADPSAQDMMADDYRIVLSFSEAALAERVTSSGATCGDQDAGSPTCGQVILYGRATAITSERMLHQVYSYFETKHSLAPWLSEGGSHMEGKYYTITLEKVRLLDYFGGFQEINLGDYLQYPVDQNSKEYFNCPIESDAADVLPATGDNYRQFLVMGLLVGSALMGWGLFCWKSNQGNLHRSSYEAVEEIETPAARMGRANFVDL